MIGTKIFSVNFEVAVEQKFLKGTDSKKETVVFCHTQAQLTFPDDQLRSDVALYST